ncbi:GAF domain-containing protein [Rhizobium deserti]|uniref:histidine kinase n=1 Tax=Rhizobium deserti TaxID=2547961 RepID=A0A4R5UGV8_9HYPH|nr:histidine kinase dimerization/phosphoacceptor domain -containing protein [Rhizobium deserti]TDK35155.1 GAF domain-containing protein [Rhizobium deserti]
MAVEASRPDHRTGPEELAHRLRQQKLAADFGHFALQTHNMQALLDEATRVCALGLSSGYSKVLEYLPNEDQFIIRAGVGWKPGIVGHARAGADLNSPAGYAYQMDVPVISNDLDRDDRFRNPRIMREHGISGAINAPIHGKNLRYGILEADSSTPCKFEEADLSFLEGLANLLGVALERQRAEDSSQAKEVRLMESEARLKQAMAHQQVLTREISHRVKNSLAMVASLLNIQGRMSTEPEVQRALSDAQTRIHTIAQVHDRLWRNNEVQTVDLAEFMSELCEQFKQTAQPGNTIEYDFLPITVQTDQAVPLGLLTNELVTNALKYAYPEGQGVISISIRQTDHGHLRLEVSDSGVGLPDGFDTASSKSLGMKVINSFSRQIGGRPAWEDANPGTMFLLDFFPQDNSDRS